MEEVTVEEVGLISGWGEGLVYFEVFRIELGFAGGKEVEKGRL